MKNVTRPMWASRRPGLTVTDVVVLLAIVTMLAALLIPAIAELRLRSKKDDCADNMRKLTDAWRKYADDNKGHMMDTGHTPAVGYVGPGNTPEANETGVLWKYVNKQKFFQCPADPSNRRARTYSINYFLGTYTYVWMYPEYVLKNIADVPKPEATIAFVDEDDPRDYNMAGFAQHIPHGEKVDSWVDVPATWHESGGNISFVDGHVEYWKYQDKRTRDLKKISEVQSPRNKDLMRVQYGMCNWPKPKPAATTKPATPPAAPPVK